MSIGENYSNGPYEYSRDREMLVEFDTDPDVVQQLLPPVLTMGADGARGWLRIARHKTSTFGPYTGAYFGVYAEHKGEAVRFLMAGIKNDWQGTIAAREVWGLPFALGEIDLEWQGSILAGRVRGHAGQELASVNLQTTSLKTTPSRALSARYKVQERDYEGNLGGHLLMKGANEFSAQPEAWNAQATLRLGQGTLLDDWSTLPVLGNLYAEYRTGGANSLPFSEIVDRW